MRSLPTLSLPLNREYPKNTKLITLQLQVMISDVEETKAGWTVNEVLRESICEEGIFCIEA